jgi:hypothetical protein
MADKELKDFSGQPYLGQIYWEDLDKDFLIRIMLVWQRQVREIAYAGYHAELVKRYGSEVAIEIKEKVCHHHNSIAIPMLMEVANIRPKTLGEAMNVLMLCLDAGTPSRKATKEEARDRTHISRTTWIDENHMKSELDYCPWADELFKQMEGLPEEAVDKYLIDMCEKMDMRLFKFYLEQTLPGKKIETWLSKKPTLKGRNDKPMCVMEAIMKE